MTHRLKTSKTAQQVEAEVEISEPFESPVQVGDLVCLLTSDDFMFYGLVTRVGEQVTVRSCTPIEP